MNKKTPGKKGDKALPKLKPVSKVKSKPKPPAKVKPPSPTKPKPLAKFNGLKDEPGFGDVMASLSKIFGGKEFLSDAEFESFLDSKIASGEIPPSAGLDPLVEAESLIFEAWNTEGHERVHLARRALDLSQDCSDAYYILAEEDAKTLPEALELYRKGMDSASRILGADLFENAVGHFWGIMETRPYMRSKFGLAKCLWELDQKTEAMEHLREMRRLNSSDNQGVRYVLIEYLLEMDADEELGQLLVEYADDASPEIGYTHALWVYRREGRSKSASALLAEAIKFNPHVPDFLLNRKKLPKNRPEVVEFGSREEAANYAIGAIEHWQNTLGALEWLGSQTQGR